MKIPGLLAVLLLFTGCAAPGPEIGSLPTAAQLKAFQSSAVDPRMMGITVYRSSTDPVFEGANRVHPGYEERYKMRSPGKAEVPVIRFDARWVDRLTALIDTRSVHCWTDLHTGGQLDFVQLGGQPYRVRPTHVKDSVSATAAYKQALKLGGLRIEDAVLYLRPAFRSLGPLSRGLEPPLPHLVLGLEVLGKFDHVSLDYPERAVVLSCKGAYKPDSKKLLAKVPLSTSSHGLLVKGRLGSYADWMLIDSGGDYGVVLPDALTPDDEALWIGDLRFPVSRQYSPQDPNRITPAYPAIGHRALSDFKVTLDFKQRLVYFEQARAE